MIDGLHRIVDLHSHIGAMSAPALNGADDTNSWNGPIVPWLRVLDGLNTRDDGAFSRHAVYFGG